MVFLPLSIFCNSPISSHSDAVKNIRQITFLYSESTNCCPTQSTSDRTTMAPRPVGPHHTHARPFPSLAASLHLCLCSLLQPHLHPSCSVNTSGLLLLQGTGTCDSPADTFSLIATWLAPVPTFRCLDKWHLLNEDFPDQPI